MDATHGSPLLERTNDPSFVVVNPSLTHLRRPILRALEPISALGADPGGATTGAAAARMAPDSVRSPSRKGGPGVHPRENRDLRSTTLGLPATGRATGATVIGSPTGRAQGGQPRPLFSGPCPTPACPRHAPTTGRRLNHCPPTCHALRVADRMAETSNSATRWNPRSRRRPTPTRPKQTTRQPDPYSPCRFLR